MASAVALSGIAIARTVCVPTQPVSPFADTVLADERGKVTVRRVDLVADGE